MSSYTLYFINLRRNHRRLTQLPPKMIEALSVFKWSMYLCLIVQNKAKSIPRQKWFLKTFHSASNKGIYPPHPFLWKKLLKKTFLVCKNGVKSIQTAGYNGARTVYIWNFQAFMNSKKNSCRNNCMRKYGRLFLAKKNCDFILILTPLCNCSSKHMP